MASEVQGKKWEQQFGVSHKDLSRPLRKLQISMNREIGNKQQALILSPKAMNNNILLICLNVLPQEIYLPTYIYINVQILDVQWE